MDRTREFMEWMKYAEDDLESAIILNNQHKKSLNIICYHCQQAAEKYLKGFLVFNSIMFEKTHDLLKILSLCQITSESASELVKDCIILNPYSIITRYPSELELTEKDALSAIDSVIRIKQFVQSKTTIPA
jgi:HEPN domain-containing protein